MRLDVFLEIFEGYTLSEPCYVHTLSTLWDADPETQPNKPNQDVTDYKYHCTSSSNIKA